MSKIPKDLLEEILNDPFYTVCVLKGDGVCGGRVTFEHAILYAGKQVQEKWAIIPLCCRHHSVNEYQDTGILNKEKNELIAITRMTKADEKRYPRKDWAQRRRYLNGKYGVPTFP